MQRLFTSIVSLFLVTAWAAPAAAQLGRDPAERKVNPALQQKIDEAIEKGTKWLVSQAKRARERDPDHAEIALYTLHHAKLGEGDPAVQDLINHCLNKQLKTNYNVSLQAVALEAINRQKYQARIAQCAQHLVDNQCRNGKWDYGEPIDMPNFKQAGNITITLGKPSRSFNLKKREERKTVTIPRIPIQQRRLVDQIGDNSNLQYACLGLRSCVMAGIDVPRDVFKRAADWLRGDQRPDGGWDYGKEHERKPSYGSMAAGAVGSLVICDFYIGQDYRRDRNVLAGIKWVRDHLKFDHNVNAPGSHLRWHYYYIYAVERAGVFTETETFGGRTKWYEAGAEFLVKSQKPDGSWLADHDLPIADTCFALLFLRRATAPLQSVATHRSGR